MLFADIDEIIDGTPIEKPQTNADRIRTMSDEELAVFLERTQADVAFNNKSKYAFEWEKWLQQPAERE